MRIIIVSDDDGKILDMLGEKVIWSAEMPSSIPVFSLKSGIDFMKPAPEMLASNKNKEDQVIDLQLPRCEGIITGGSNKGKKCNMVACKRINGSNFCLSHFGSRLPVCEFATRYTKCGKKVDGKEKFCEKHRNVKQCMAIISKGKNSGKTCLQIVSEGNDFCDKHMDVCF